MEMEDMSQENMENMEIMPSPQQVPPEKSEEDNIDSGKFSDGAGKYVEKTSNIKIKGNVAPNKLNEIRQKEQNPEYEKRLKGFLKFKYGIDLGQQQPPSDELNKPQK